ncbi:BURP domain-containing protein BNM2A-like [Fagus crenata]
MLNFVRATFRLDTSFKVLTTTHFTKSTSLNYTILEVPQEVSASKMVACHIMPYPYVVYYCHSQESENKVFQISLGGDHGERVKAIAVCYMDGSQPHFISISQHQARNVSAMPLLLCK